MCACNVRGDSSGLTLVELMIVLLLSLVLTSAVYLATQSSRHTSNEQQQVMALQQDLRAVMDIMERDIHNSGCSPMSAGHSTNVYFGIAEQGGQSLTFTEDLNGNGTVDDQTERITYCLENNQLVRCTYSCPDTGNQSCRIPIPIAQNVLSLEFIYYDENGLPSVQAVSTRSVEVKVKMKSSKSQFERVMTRRIQFRNAGFLS